MISKTEQIHVPRKAIKYILFQRTNYLFIHRNKIAKFFMGILPKKIASPLESLITSFNGLVAVEAFFTAKKVEKLFSEEMFKEFEQIAPYLPKNVNSILDIGSGVAGIDVALGRHYKNCNPFVCLLDKTEMPSKVYYSFKEKGCYYNSLSVSKDLLVKNGIPNDKILTQEATDDNKINFNKKFDLILSLISWGFHYPVSTYIDQVYDALAPDGTLILDVRKGQGGTELLKEKFGNVKIISDFGKQNKVMVKKIK